jgi:peptide deformylase
MAILKVARMGHPVLRRRARALERAEVKSVAIQRLIDDMIETMHEYRGVGLAAPQVHESVRVFLAAVDENEADLIPTVFLNPEVTVVSNGTVDDWEGCLSIPEIRGKVPRGVEVKVRALDRDGARFELRALDFPARVIQHENDHLDGVLFVDRMRGFETLTFLEEYARYWAKED